MDVNGIRAGSDDAKRCAVALFAIRFLGLLVSLVNLNSNCYRF